MKWKYKFNCFVMFIKIIIGVIIFFTIITSLLVTMRVIQFFIFIGKSIKDVIKKIRKWSKGSTEVV